MHTTKTKLHTHNKIAHKRTHTKQNLRAHAEQIHTHQKENHTQKQNCTHTPNKLHTDTYTHTYNKTYTPPQIAHKYTRTKKIHSNLDCTHTRTHKTKLRTPKSKAYINQTAHNSQITEADTQQHCTHTTHQTNYTHTTH